MTYHYTLEHYEGPLDVLLALIEEQKMDITRVSLAQVADQFIGHIGSQSSVSLEHLAEFLRIASKLILIKSKSLLPTLDISDEEEEDMHDLEWQLKEYKKFKEATQEIQLRMASPLRSLDRPGYVGVGSLYYPPSDISSEQLAEVFSRIVGEIPLMEKLDEDVVKDIITLEERINDLQYTLRNRVQTSFAELVREATDKVDVIISFLALLELMKQKLVLVEQNDIFMEIKVSQVISQSV